MSSAGLATFIPAFLLLALAIFARAIGRSWLEPGPFFALAWSIFTLVPLIMAPDYYVWAGGVWWILISSICICCGDWVVSARKRHTVDLSDDVSLESRKTDMEAAAPAMATMLLVATIVGFLASAYAIISSGFDISVFSSSDFATMTQQISIDRYSGFASAPGIISQIMLVGVFSGPLLGGLVFAAGKLKRYKYLSLLSLAPALTLFAVQTTRFVFVIALIFWVSTYFAGRIYLRKLTSFHAKSIAMIVVIPLTMMILFGIGQSLRVGEMPSWSKITANLATPATRSALYGHISVFSQWFQEDWNDPQKPSLGVYTFAGPLSKLGIEQREQGLYDYSYEVEPKGFSNIYTTFRGIIEDYTLPGSLFILFVAGLAASFSYHRLVAGNKLFLPILVTFYAFTVDYLASIFTYNSCIAALVIMGIVVIYWEKEAAIEQAQPAHSSKFFLTRTRRTHGKEYRG